MKIIIAAKNYIFDITIYRVIIKKIWPIYDPQGTIPLKKIRCQFGGGYFREWDREFR